MFSSESVSLIWFIQMSEQVAYFRELGPQSVKTPGSKIVESVEGETQLLGGVLKSGHDFATAFSGLISFRLLYSC